jgi:hypothetical protein
MRHISRIVLFVCVLIGANATGLRAAILTPNDVLQVRFTVAPASPTPDVLTMSLGIVQVLAAHTSRTGALFDGNTLLGTGSTSSFGGHVGALSLSPARSWRSPASVWDFDFPAVADFTTIQNGTIDGRVDFTIQTGAMDIDLNNVGLSMGQAIAPNIFLNSNPQPVITSVQIVPIPEPATLTACALAGLLVRRRRRA